MGPENKYHLNAFDFSIHQRDFLQILRMAYWVKWDEIAGDKEDKSMSRWSLPSSSAS